MAEPDWLAVRVIKSFPPLLRGVHVLVEVDGVPLLNTFHDGFSHVVGAHPESFLAPGSAAWAPGESVGDPVDCQPECCGVGAWVWRRAGRVHWQLVGDRWSREVLSEHLEFEREEYLFTLECARDRWLARSGGSAPPAATAGD